jgi:hypothetical protein
MRRLLRVIIQWSCRHRNYAALVNKTPKKHIKLVHVKHIKLIQVLNDQNLPEPPPPEASPLTDPCALGSM